MALNKRLPFKFYESKQSGGNNHYFFKASKLSAQLNKMMLKSYAEDYQYLLTHSRAHTFNFETRGNFNFDDHTSNITMSAYQDLHGKKDVHDAEDNLDNTVPKLIFKIHLVISHIGDWWKLSKHWRDINFAVQYKIEFNHEHLMKDFCNYPAG